MMRVVLTPELLVRAFIEPDCLGVLQQWRDGRLVPVISRGLALHYTKLLKKTGLDSVQLRRWLWWFSDGERAEFLPDSNSPPGSTASLCNTLAVETNADCVVHSDNYQPPSFEHGKHWRPASAFITELKSS